MSSYREFNNYILKNGYYHDLIKYIHRINKLSKEPMNISFMEELLKYIDQDDCVIPHNMLVKYKIIDEYNSSVITRELLNKDVYKFIENKDYKVSGFSEFKFVGGVIRERNYLLHPRTFKLLLMQTNKTARYAKYYLLLEEAIKYYNEYLNARKNSKMEELSKKIDEQSKQLEEQGKKIEEMMTYIKEITNLLTISLKEDEINIIPPSKSW